MARRRLSLATLALLALSGCGGPAPGDRLLLTSPAAFWDQFADYQRAHDSRLPEEDRRDRSKYEGREDLLHGGTTVQVLHVDGTMLEVRVIEDGAIPAVRSAFGDKTGARGYVAYDSDGMTPAR